MSFTNANDLMAWAMQSLPDVQIGLGSDGEVILHTGLRSVTTTNPAEDHLEPLHPPSTTTQEATP